jgi:hypothetical protein
LVRDLQPEHTVDVSWLVVQLPLDHGTHDRQARKLRGMFEKNLHTVGKSASTAG